jgi:hypothetical protein
MELLLYIWSNWCCMLAAGVLLWSYYKPSKRSQYKGGELEEDIMISRDLQISLMIGSFSRVYWSCSPPVVWGNEPTIIQWLSMFDVFVSPLVWTAVVILVGLKQRKYLTAPVHFSWPVLCGVAFAISLLASYLLPDTHDDHSGWPLAGVMIMFNMLLEGFAMIPQMHLVANTTDKASGPEASHFVGLLSFSRVLRIIFWAIMMVPDILSGDAHGFYIWSFLVPDVLHTVIMGDFLYVWLTKVKQEAVDPIFQQMEIAV